ncbi:MAG: chromate transporter [Chloroflexi bacterium]|nr:chromate transporter [Chloroflexota bacterium]
MRVALGSLARVFGLVGLTSFGGGRSAYFHDSLVFRRKWFSDEEFLETLAVTQILPGPTFFNMSVFFGQRLSGPLGALLAAVLILGPGACLMLVLSHFYFSGLDLPGTTAVFKGIGAAAVALSLATTLRVARRAAQARGGAALALATFLGVGVLQLNALLVLPVLTAIGLWLNRPRWVR